MTALWSAARQQLLRTTRHRTLRICSVLLAALVLLGLLLEGLQHRQDLERQAQLQARVEREWREQPDRHPHRASHFGSFAFRPPGVLAFFEPGLQTYAGRAIFLEPHQRNLPGFSAASESSELVRFGRPSAAFVLQLLAPLLLFCMTFASVAGEREGGTWQLSLAQGASASALVLGKALGALAALCLWVVPAAGLGLAALLATRLVAPSWEAAARGVVLAAVYLLYLAACALLGVAVSSRYRRPPPALLSLLALWIGLWILVPRLAAAAAGAAHPAPTRAQLDVDIARAVRSLGDSHDPDHPHFAALKQETLRKHGVATVEELPINYGGLVMSEAERLSTEVFNDFHLRLRRAQHAQDQLALSWGGYTPLLALRVLSMAAAGTDSAHLAHFDVQAEAHRYRLVQRLNELHANEIRWENDRAQRVDSSEWSHFERFAPAGPPWPAVLRGALPALLALLAWALVGLAASTFSHRSTES